MRNELAGEAEHCERANPGPGCLGASRSRWGSCELLQDQPVWPSTPSAYLTARTWED